MIVFVGRWFILILKEAERHFRESRMGRMLVRWWSRAVGVALKMPHILWRASFWAMERERVSDL
jgi:hypothetical protein